MSSAEDRDGRNSPQAAAAVSDSADDAAEHASNTASDVVAPSSAQQRDAGDGARTRESADEAPAGAASDSERHSLAPAPEQIDGPAVEKEQPARRTPQQEQEEIEQPLPPSPGQAALQSHQRQTSLSKVNKAETSAVKLAQDGRGQPTTETDALRTQQEASPAAALEPETKQHRHDVRADRPGSYQPSVPLPYLQIRAMGIQLPSSMASTSSTHSHIDPPSLVLEARTNLSSARRSFYPRVTRSLPELQLWILALTLSFPAGIFSPFLDPPALLTAGASRTADDIATRNYLITITRQFDRILRKPYVLSHPATVALMDCDFNYNAAMPHIGPGSSHMSRRKMEDGTGLVRMGHDPLRGSKRVKNQGGGGSVMSTWDVDGVAAALGLPALPMQNGHDVQGQAAPAMSKNPLNIFSRASASPQRITTQPQIPIPPGQEDEDEEDLTAARNEITRLELQFERASKAAHVLVERKGAMTSTLHQLNQSFADLARLDAGRALARRTKQDGAAKTMQAGIDSWVAASNAESGALLATLSPGMAYQSHNARTAIDALLRRASAASHRYSALVVLVQRRREAERLKRARGAISQEEVDWVLGELRDAQRTTQVLTHHLSTFTATLKEELKEHSRNTHADVQDALLQHARSSIRAQRFSLLNLMRARDGLVAMREGRLLDDASIPTGGAAVEPPAAVDAVPEIDNALEEVMSVANARVPVRTSSMSSASISSRDKDLPSRPSEVAEPFAAPGAEEVQSSLSSSGAGPSRLSPDRHAGAALGDQEAGPTAEGVTSPKRSAAAGGPDGPRAALQSLSQSASLPSPANKRADMPSPSASSAQFARPLSSATSDTTSPPGMESPRRLAADVDPATHHTGAGPGYGTDPGASAGAPMSQSAFLPGRNMQRYANPFVRMDGGGGSSFVNPATAGGAPGGGQAAFSGAGGFPSRAPAGGSFESAQPGASAPASRAQQQGEPQAGKPADPWANRSRLSASDAARSLAGRF